MNEILVYTCCKKYPKRKRIQEGKNSKLHGNKTIYKDLKSIINSRRDINNYLIYELKLLIKQDIIWKNIYNNIKFIKQSEIKDCIVDEIILINNI